MRGATRLGDAQWRHIRAIAGCALAASVVCPLALAAQGGGSDSTSRMPPARSSGPAYDSTLSDTSFAYAAVMGLDAVVAATLRNSPDMAQAGGALRTGQSGERVAYGQFLPSLTLNSGAFQTSARSLTLGGAPVALGGGTYPAQSYSAGLAASYDVFTGGRRSADIAAARATTHAADANLIAQRYAVELTAKTAFYGVRRARDLVVVSVTREATALRALQYADARLRRGTATRADVLLARLNLATARQQLIAARDTLTTNAYALGRLVGVEGAVGAQSGASDSLPDVALGLSDSAIVALAIHSGPAVRAAEAESQASDASVRSATTQYVPDIKVTGGYNWANNSLAFGADPARLADRSSAPRIRCSTDSCGKMTSRARRRPRTRPASWPSTSGGSRGPRPSGCWRASDSRGRTSASRKRRCGCRPRTCAW